MAGESPRVLLEETFYVLSKKRTAFRVQLLKTGLILTKVNQNESKTRVIPIRDVVGVRCFRTKKKTSCVGQVKIVEDDSKDEDDLSATLHLYVYTLTDGERQKETITLRFQSYTNYEDNVKECERWRTALHKLMEKDSPRRLLVLLSPKSGAGNGRTLFQDKIAPVLQEAEVLYDLHVTKYKDYAREFVRGCNLSQWSGVAVVGGDGVVFEVINGLLERPDWREVLQTTPIGVIPGGSGNGLARSIAFNRGEPYSNPPLAAALSLTRNLTTPMDLVRVETASEVMFSFLSVGWGLLSDVDIESERLRALGGHRFTLWAVARLVGLRTYTGRLYYLPAGAPLEDRKGEPAAELPVDVGALGSNHGRPDTVTGPPSRLPPLTSPLPATWRTVSGGFVMVHASYQSHISADCSLAPDAKLDDGVIWLLVVHAAASRSQILQFLLGLNNGAHARSQQDNIELIPVKAFRIEPNLHESGYLTVDGENVAYGAVQAEVFPGMVNVMVP